MSQELTSWRQDNSNRVFARQRAQVDTAKLLATFSLGVAATLVATTLQVGDPKSLDFISAGVLAAAFLATLAVIALDRLREGDPKNAFVRARVGSWSDVQLLDYLQSIADEAESENEIVVKIVRRATDIALLLATAAGVLAAVALLV